MGLNWSWIAVLVVGCGGGAFEDAPAANRFTVDPDAAAADAAGDAAAELPVSDPDGAAAPEVAPEISPDAPGEATSPDAGPPEAAPADAPIEAPGPDAGAPEADAGVLTCDVASCPAPPGAAVKCCTDTAVCGYVAAQHCYPLKPHVDAGAPDSDADLP